MLLTPDALLLRLLEVDQWTTVFWRGVLLAAMLAAVLVIVYRGRFPEACRAIGLVGVAVALCLGVEAVLFVVAIVHTSVANTVIIVAAAPLFAAVLSHVFLGEPTGLATWLAILAAIGGIALVVWDGAALGTSLGDGAAIASALGFAAALVILRRARAADMLPATALSGLVQAALVLPFAAPLAVGAEDVPPLAAMGLVVLPGAFGLFTLGTRYIAAAEVGLLTLLQTVLAPIWVWLALGEAMTARGLAGGAIVVATLAVHSALGIRRAAALD